MTEGKYSRYSNIRINYKFWMSSETGDAIIDDDKWQLLIAIQKLGSLKAASDEMKISYRKVWGDLKKVEEILGFAVIDKHRGGKDGGASSLTDEGIQIVELFEKFHASFDSKFKAELEKIISK